MQTKPTSNRMFSHLVLYDMHTKFLYAALDSIKDEDAHNRLKTKANHIAWLAGSIVQQRFEVAQLFGATQISASDEFFKNNKGIQDNITYPPLKQFLQDWESITPVLREIFMNLPDTKLDEIYEMMPQMKMPYFDFISFVIYREASIIGQLALWRRFLGYEAMKYM
ncbi:MAG: DinB family protein [Ginsengibacter sp.]